MHSIYPVVGTAIQIDALLLEGFMKIVPVAGKNPRNVLSFAFTWAVRRRSDRYIIAIIIHTAAGIVSLREGNEQGVLTVSTLTNAYKLHRSV